MKRTVRLTERDLTRLVRRVIKEDQERFTLNDVQDGTCGTSGTWEVRNGSLILTDCNMNGTMIDAQITI
jgi:hypothetical protein